jgi:23S rRNA (cytidine1920-2'-O)/16S rRNA (cytidine1409-2'-O)-methyltransferase
MHRPSAQVPQDAILEVIDVPDGVEYASRAAHKLSGALALTGVDPAGLRCLDAGASTGGFTDVLLRHGAAQVVAVDIGHDQLVPHVRDDPRVEVHDGTSIRGMRTQDICGPVDLLVGDLSFISLRLVMADLVGLVRDEGRLLLMVKPQFEVGRGHLGRGGVVGDVDARLQAVLDVARSAAMCGAQVDAAVASPLPGQDGNREFFLSLLHRHAQGPGSDPGPHAYDMIERAVRSPHVTQHAPEGGPRVP